MEGAAMKHYRRRWDSSRGDAHDAWGSSDWYFEADGDGFPVRQMEVYDGGQVLKYDDTHVEDEYGCLGDQALDLREFSAYIISASDFDAAWVENAALNR
jgi:hypothetical protein